MDEIIDQSGRFCTNSINQFVIKFAEIKLCLNCENIKFKLRNVV